MVEDRAARSASVEGQLAGVALSRARSRASNRLRWFSLRLASSASWSCGGVVEEEEDVATVRGTHVWATMPAREPGCPGKKGKAVLRCGENKKPFLRDMRNN